MNEFFKHKLPIFERLPFYGFSESGGEFVYETQIFEKQFKLIVKISKNGKVKPQLFDNATEELYTLHLVEEAEGEFVTRVREEYSRVLQEIAEKCFERAVFQTQSARALIEHIRTKFGDEPEFLWKNSPEAAVFRRKDNEKWYAVLLTVERKKLGLEGEGKIEIIDVRADPLEAELLVDGKRIFKGWHMNKKHWITLPFESANLEELFERLEESYFIAGRR